MTTLTRAILCLVMIAASLPTVAWSATEAEEWTRLNARKDQLVQQLRKLQQDYQAAKSEEQQEEIAKAFEVARTEFTTKVLPQITELAPKVFAADPKNFEAGETALQIAFQENRYDDAVKFSDQLLAAGNNSLIVQNMGGVSLFATHQFEKALALLKAAEEAGQLHPQLGARYLDAAEQYIPLWKKEAEIRAKEAAAEGDDKLPRVKFATNKGDITIELFENEAPNTVANFISLVENKTYEGIKFHRVIPTFMAQGGDPLSKDDDPSNDGTGGPGYVIPCECYRPDARMHFRGSLSMAHAGKDTGGSQFFITHLPTSHLNPNAQQQRGHTVFGRVVEGLDVAAGLEVGDTINVATVLNKRDHEYKPKTLPDPRR